LADETTHVPSHSVSRGKLRGISFGSAHLHPHYGCLDTGVMAADAVSKTSAISRRTSATGLNPSAFAPTRALGSIGNVTPDTSQSSRSCQSLWPLVFLLAFTVR